MLGTFIFGITIMAMIGVGALFMSGTSASEAPVQRCPKCRRIALRKYKAGSHTASAGWKCTECGNDRDEFGNRL